MTTLNALQKKNAEILALAREVRDRKTRSYVAAASVLADFVIDHLGDMTFVGEPLLQQPCAACGAKFGDHLIERDKPGAQCPTSAVPE